jgi:DNA-binding beta-propeller fold protein YncE
MWRNSGEDSMSPTKLRLGLIAAALGMALAAPPLALAADPPRYQVDPFWPQALPNNWILGQASGVTVDRDQNVWVLQRPRSLTADEAAADQKPPTASCCSAAPPVIQFSPDGKVLKAWGGPGEGYQWPQNEHGILVDARGFIWIGANGAEDGQILKFTADGKYVLQIGKQGPQTHSSDLTRLGRPAGFAYDAATDEIYVADGYHNQRVIVFDGMTGAYKRHWGAYGLAAPSVAAPNALGGSNPKEFGTPVHCVRLSRDGLVYVCDRSRNRVQIFRKDGTFVNEWTIARETLDRGSAWDIALIEPEQEYLLLADGTNNQVHVLRRTTGEVVGRIGRSGRGAGDFHWIHNLAVNGVGDMFTTEVDNGKRVQKFRRLPN